MFGVALIKSQSYKNMFSVLKAKFIKNCQGNVKCAACSTKINTVAILFLKRNTGDT